MTVEEMLSRMTSSEITAWRGYEETTGPLGPERDDVLSTLVAFYVVKALGAKKARLDQMMPRWDRPRMAWQQMKAVFQKITHAFGGDDGESR